MLPADTAPEPVDPLVWELAVGAEEPGPNPIPPGATVLVVSAHPDDETIGAGRLIADHDGPVRCITLTAGESCFGTGGTRSEREAVGEERIAEWEKAVAALGAEPVHTERWPDGELDEHVHGAVSALVDVLMDVEVVLAPWAHDPHPDHEAAARIGANLAAAAGVPLVSYLVWTPYWKSPAEAAALGGTFWVVPTSPEADEAREAAMAHYTSQTEARPPASKPVVPKSLVSRHAWQLLAESPDVEHP